MGQVSGAADGNGTVVQYRYNSFGKVRERRIYNIFSDPVYEKAIGADGEESCLCTWQYDSLGRLIRDGNLSCLETRSGEVVLLSFTYRYDGNGNRTAKMGSQGFTMADFQGFSVSGTQNFATTRSSALQRRTLDIAYQYDIHGQLLEEQRDDQSVWYTYDAAGSHIKKTDTNEGIVYHYNRENQLISKVRAWTIKHNAESVKINWQFKTKDARIKLTRLYPVTV